jgi:DNA repair exonuclease SbcCD ATPase subunit
MTNKILFVLALVVCAGAYYEYRGVTQELVRTKAALVQEQQKVAELKAEVAKAMPAELAKQLRPWANDLMIREARVKAVATDLERWRKSLNAFAESLDKYRQDLIATAANVAYEAEQNQKVLSEAESKVKFAENLERRSVDISNSLYGELQNLRANQEGLEAQIGSLQDAMNSPALNQLALDYYNRQNGPPGPGYSIPSGAWLGVPTGR